MEGNMCKSLITMTVAMAIVLAGSLMSDRAQAGSSTSGASKYNAAIIAASQPQAPRQYQRPVRIAKSDITSFSSSSARSSVPRH
jgi:hypothetical protein